MISVYSSQSCSDGARYYEYVEGWYERGTNIKVSEGEHDDEEPEEYFYVIEDTIITDKDYQSRNRIYGCSNFWRESYEDNYACVSGLGWLCINPDGCECGENTCTPGHFCIEPMKCSHGIFSISE
jgi:hypothetical protein